MHVNSAAPAAKSSALVVLRLATGSTFIAARQTLAAGADKDGPLAKGELVRVLAPGAVSGACECAAAAASWPFCPGEPGRVNTRNKVVLKDRASA